MRASAESFFIDETSWMGRKREWGGQNVRVGTGRHERRGGIRFQYKRAPAAVKSPP